MKSRADHESVQYKIPSVSSVVQSLRDVRDTLEHDPSMDVESETNVTLVIMPVGKKDPAKWSIHEARPEKVDLAGPWGFASVGAADSLRVLSETAKDLLAQARNR